MDFNSFLEGVDRNSYRKRDAQARALGFDDIHPSSNPRIKDLYNNLNIAIHKKSWPIADGKYILIPPTIFKTSSFYILHKEEANKALWKMYEEAIENPNSRETWDLEMMFDDLIRNHKVSAGSLSVDKNKIGQYGMGYDIGTAAIDRRHQGQGLMLEVYRTIVLNGIPLSSSSQSAGAIKTWQRLAQTPGIKVIGSDYQYKSRVELTVTEKGFSYQAELHEGDTGGVTTIVAYKGK